MALLTGFDQETDDHLLTILPVASGGAGWDARIDTAVSVLADAARMTERWLSYRDDVDLDFSSGDGVIIYTVPAGFWASVSGIVIINRSDVTAVPTSSSKQVIFKQGSTTLRTIAFNAGQLAAPGIRITRMDTTIEDTFPILYPPGTNFQVDAGTGSGNFPATGMVVAVLGFLFPA